MSKRQLKLGRLCLNDRSCIRLRQLYARHVWSYDFVSTRTQDGRPIKLLTVIEEYTRECMAIKVARLMKAHHLLEALADLFAERGPPEHLRSDNGPECRRSSSNPVVRGRMATTIASTANLGMSS